MRDGVLQLETKDCWEHQNNPEHQTILQFGERFRENKYYSYTHIDRITPQIYKYAYVYGYL